MNAAGFSCSEENGREKRPVTGGGKQGVVRGFESYWHVEKVAGQVCP